MKKIAEAEGKELMLKMLDKISEFCAEKNITYYLGFGTLLGAVRHNGFIPWDDDIDILMPRSDYETFIKEFSKLEGNYKVGSLNTDGHHYCWAKVYDDRTVKFEFGVNYKRCRPYGIDIDIFPIDKLPSNISDSEIDKYFKEVKNTYYQLYFANSKLIYDRINIKRIIGCLVYGLVGKIYGNTRLMKKFNDISTRYSNLEDDYKLMVTDLSKPIFLQEDFKEKIELPFEDRIYFCPSGYSNILTAMYGDYMQLPPENKRVTHHAFDVFWK